MALRNQQFHLYLWFAVVVVLRLWQTPTYGRPLDHANLSIKERHEHWMARHGRIYKDLIEKEKRYNIFKHNVELIDKFNDDAWSGKSFKLGVNAFADLTTQEVVATHTGYKKQIRSKSMTEFVTTNRTNRFTYEGLNSDMFPESLDWRERGAVTSVKNQGKCGCCWAFSTVAAIEGINQIKTGNLVSLSEQQLLDCAQDTYGCDGGEMTNAFAYVAQSQGLLTDEEYSYKDIQMQCQVTSGGVGGPGYIAVAISNYVSIPKLDEDALMQAVSQQPVAVGIDNSAFEFIHYKGGVFDGQCGQQITHAVAIVGYGTNHDGTKYWLLKNSWGETWGDNGYMKLIRGQNHCGITLDASYPVIMDK